MADQLERLKAALADRYAIERPLGAGGMAVVYLAEDLKHRRPVALKVLKPEFAEALGAERFLKEIEVVARLNHPHILPLHDSGQSDGLLYFVMPVAEGESLRAMLRRVRQLPIDEAVRITRQIASALDHAHRQGVLHRDIKPENILLQEGEAMLTDFGIALPVGQATDTRITEVGETLGTADYMSPEQSKGVQELDARSDVYSLGCVLFEMLAGEPPFTGHNRQSVIGKRITEQPPEVTTRREAVAASLGRTVTKALAMSPADRYDSAAAFAEALEREASAAFGPATRMNHPVTAAALFGVASLVILAAVYFLMLQLGLPNWVLRGAVGLLIVGLPIIVATALAERRRTVQTAGSRGPQRWLNWRRALQGGGLAFTGLGVVTAGFMSMRVLGIGPAGTLMAKGVLAARDPILLADFENRTDDPTLAATITAGLRIDLSQSRVVRLVEAASVGAALERMVVDPDAPLHEGLARQVAEREGVKAVLAGEVASVGSGYMLAARLISPTDGTLLGAERVTAKDDTELITAIDRLSARIRENIGESLRDVRASPPLARVTTSSLDALRKYTQAVQAEEQSGDQALALQLLEETVALDSTFAMAYRKLGNTLENAGRTDASLTAFRRAFDLRQRLPDRERYHIEAYYYAAVDYDGPRVIQAYRSLLTLDPDDYRALTNLASNLSGTRQWAERESLALRAVELAGPWQSYANALNAQLLQGKFVDAEATLDRFAESDPDNRRAIDWRIDLTIAKREYDRAERLLRTQIANAAPDHSLHMLGDLMHLRGRMAEAERWFREWLALDDDLSRVFPALYHLAVLARERGDSAEAIRLLDSFPLDLLPPVERPHLALAEFHAANGRLDRAKALMAADEAAVSAGRRQRPERQQALHQVSGEIALRERRFADAVTHFRLANELAGRCLTCGLARLAYALERRDQEDSALAVYDRLVSTPIGYLDLWGIRWVGLQRVRGLPQSYRRLGELHEARGETADAIDSYNAFVELWKDADPELQPLVEDVRRRIAQLAGEPGVTRPVR